MDYLEELNPKQKEAVDALDGVVMISAGAGSGKTKVLTCRIARLIQKGVPSYHILGITFTNKAAKEMKTRLNAMVGESDVTLKTFHSLCVTILKHEQLENYGKRWGISDTSKSTTIMKKILKELNSQYKPDTVLNYISDKKEKGFTPEEWGREIDRTIPAEEKRFHSNMLELYYAYQDKLVDDNLMDFDDLLLNTVLLFRNHADIRKKYQNKFQYILVDEYQDTNHIQYELIKLLFTKNLCVVGDADQSIYGWRGADETNISDFHKDFPNYKLILLEQNYRSTSIILEAANAVISNNEGRIEKNLWTNKEVGDPIKYTRLSSDVEEGNFIAESIEKLHLLGINYKDMAVLYRMNNQSRQIEQSLINARIPYTVIGGMRFWERKDIKDILAYLNVFMNPADETSLLRVINYPSRGLGKQVIEAAKGYAKTHGMILADALQTSELPITETKRNTLRWFFDTIYECASAENIPDFLENIVNKFGIIKQIEKECDKKNGEDYDERIANIEELIAFARTFMEDPFAEHGLDDFLNHIALYSDADTENRIDGVSLMTIHAAKGLEFPVVFLPGLEDNIFPTYKVLTDPDFENVIKEERRLMYVAITRAKTLLFISNAEKRMSYQGITENDPSMFLSEIPPELLD